MSDFVIRRAGVDDASAVADVQVRGWRETYSHLVAPGELDEPSLIDVRRERWTSILVGPSVVWLAEDGGLPVGFSSSAARDPYADGRAPRELELNAIYLIADHHGSGLGQQLLDLAVGAEPAFLFVAEDNPRAIRFYERNGFTFDGACESYPLVRTPITSRRMVR